MYMTFKQSDQTKPIQNNPATANQPPTSQRTKKPSKCVCLSLWYIGEKTVSVN